MGSKKRFKKRFKLESMCFGCFMHLPKNMCGEHVKEFDNGSCIVTRCEVGKDDHQCPDCKDRVTLGIKGGCCD